MKNPEKLKLLNESIIKFNDLHNNIDDINYRDIAGGTPLAWAVVLGNYELVTKLISMGANMHARVFPYLYQVIKIDYIIDPALTILTQFLPAKVKLYIKKDIIMKILRTLRDYNYINSEGIQIKYIASVIYEVTKHECFIKSIINRWKTQEDFDRKMKLSFWLYPKLADSNNYYIQKFYKNKIVSAKLRNELVDKFLNNPNESYKKITELIKLNNNHLDVFLNESWFKIIIPDMLNNMMIPVICQSNL